MADEAETNDDSGQEEDESLLGQEDDGGGTGEEGNDDDHGSAGGDLDVDALVATLEDRLSKRFDTIADRRVNAILSELRKQEKQPPKTEESVAPPPEPKADERGARLAFREYLGDTGLKFVGAEERAFASDLGALMISQRVAAGELDEDVIGRDVAAEVKTKIEGLRKHYERATKDALKRKGLLKEPDAGQPPRGGSSTSQQSEFDKGADKAKQIRPAPVSA